MMRKNKWLFLIAIFLSASAQAQLTKGNWLVGGSGKLYAYHQTYTYANFNVKSKYTDIDLSPSIGYFLIDKLAIGIKPSFYFYKGGDTGNSSGASGGHAYNTKFFVGPFGRYYFLKTDKPFNILSDITYQFGINSWHPTEGHINNFSILVGPELFFNSSVGIEILLGYSAKKETINDAVVGNVYTTKGFQTSIGFQVHLEK